MARDDQLSWAMLDDVTKAAQAYLNPVLAGGLDAKWEPTEWSWRLQWRVHAERREGPSRLTRRATRSAAG